MGARSGPGFVAEQGAEFTRSSKISHSHALMIESTFGLAQTKERHHARKIDLTAGHENLGVGL
jgi:hypothetical protein